MWPRRVTQMSFFQQHEHCETQLQKFALIIKHHLFDFQQPAKGGKVLVDGQGPLKIVSVITSVLPGAKPPAPTPFKYCGPTSTGNDRSGVPCVCQS